MSVAGEPNGETTEDQVAEVGEAEAASAAAPEAGTAEPEAPPAAALEGDAGAQEGPLHPKETRRRARSIHQGEARPQREASDRQAERDAARADKARRRRAYRAGARAKAAKRRGEGPPAPATPPVPTETRRAKVRQGVVVSDRPDKTITVRVDITRRHRLYEKTLRSSSKLHVHDERNEAHAGDTVRVVETRPLSRTKRWRLLEIVERAR